MSVLRLALRRFAAHGQRGWVLRSRHLSEHRGAPDIPAGPQGAEDALKLPQNSFERALLRLLRAFNVLVTGAGRPSRRWAWPSCAPTLGGESPTCPEHRGSTPPRRSRERNASCLLPAPSPSSTFTLFHTESMTIFVGLNQSYGVFIQYYIQLSLKSEGRPGT